MNPEAATGFYVNTGGIYLHRNPIPFDGTLLAIEVFGFTGEASIDSITESDIFFPEPLITPAFINGQFSEPFLFILIYRPIMDGTVYELVHGPTQMSHGLAPERIFLQFDVQEGDFIGVYIPRECVNRTDTEHPQCPSQVNLRTNSCRSAFYYSGLDGVDSIPVMEFEEVSVNLNMLAVFAPGKYHFLGTGFIGTVLTVQMFEIHAQRLKQKHG